ncbi:MAG: hypothetical protein HND52_15230 [Ignavibacteriae bacterium]|nr:hypothetical protein [Ignavibacteriota bacterium]NOG99307.1 hypothetical protein [Ignavibacteriota bacterium]
MIKIKILLMLIILFVNFIGCSSEAPKTTEEEKNAQVIAEHPVIEIPLPENIARRSTEISGLTWYKDYLIILPQFPKRMAKENISRIFTISKKDILNYLETKDASGLNFHPIDFIEKGLEKYSGIGSGYEAITFIDSTAFLTIEFMKGSRTESLVVKGILDFDLKILTLDSASLTKIPSEDKIFNLSNETITQFENNIITIYEANGKAITDKPNASLYDTELNYKNFLPMPNIEYRITDATDADSSGKFWVLNYFYPKDYKKLSPMDDEIVKKFGVGSSHKNSPAVERIIQLVINEDGIELGMEMPIYLELLDDDTGRNWEGLAKLNNLGFLIATDTHPKTILAFVPAELSK